jgi:magnesium chelatase accessory protein
VQIKGDGPAILLLHGTGGAGHSWRGLIEPLSQDFTVIVPDLPGHGFTQKPSNSRLSISGMARALADLLAALQAEPVLVVGHSAGVAVAARMCLSGLIHPAAIVGFNAALLPLGGLPGRIFSPVAKLLALNPLVPNLFAWRAGGERFVSRLLRDTGSVIDEEGIRLYARLVGDPGHAAGALAMMANWDLRSMEIDLPKLKTPMLLVAAERDRAILPRYADQVARLTPAAEVRPWAGLGHLAHEEDPEGAVAIIRAVAAEHGALDPKAPRKARSETG